MLSPDARRPQDPAYPPLPARSGKFVCINPHPSYLLNFCGEMLQKIKERGHDVIVFGPKSSDAAKLSDLGFGYREFPIERAGMNPFTDVETFTALRRLLKAERPDCVFMRGIKAVTYGSLAAATCGIENAHSLMAGLGYAFAEEDRSFKRTVVSAIVRAELKTVLRFNRTVIFENPDDARHLIDLGIVRSDQVRMVAGVGVNLEKFSPSPESAADPAFLMISRLLKPKGVGEYVEAAKRVREVRPELECRLMGPTWDTPDAYSLEQVRAWEAEGAITYLGAKPDVREDLRRAYALVHPSYYREGIPTILLEAMAMQKPIVTTTSVGCREAVHDGVEGLAVPPRDSKALAAAMLEIYQQKERAVEMAKRARERAVEVYDRRKVVSDYIKIFGL